MKKTLLLIIILASSILAQYDLASASTAPLKEDLKIFVTKDSVVVSAALSGEDLSLRELDNLPLEGVNSYRLIASHVVEWLPEFYILGDEGYKALPINPVPKEGLNLVVEAEGKRQADSAAQALGKTLKAAFIPIGAEGSKYTYYSHIDFKFTSKMLLDALPELKDGFTNLLKSIFDKKNLQIIVLDVQRSQTSFSKHLTLLYAESKGLTPTFDFDSVLPLFSNTTASKDVAETVVEVVFADALISKDNSLRSATVVNFPENISSKVSFKLAGGEKPLLSKIDLIYCPPLLKVERLIDSGVVEAVEGKDTVEVTIKIQNVAPVGSVAAEGLSLNERWWVEKFDLVSGKTTLTNLTLKAGEKEELRYVIKVKEKTPSEFLVEGKETPITYTYRLGSEVFNGRAYPNDIRLILNKPRPTLIATLEAQEPTPLKPSNTLILKVGNLGARSAENISVRVENISVAHNPILKPLENWKVEVPVEPQHLTQPLREVKVLVQWVDEEGEKQTYTNTVSVLFSRSTIGAPKLDLMQSASISPDKSGFTLKSVVAVKVTSVNGTTLRLTTNLPEGFELTGGDFTQKAGSIEVVSLVSKGDVQQNFSYTLRASEYINFVQPPILGEVDWGGFKLKSASNSYTYAEGVRVSFNISKTVGFRGSTSNIKASIVNLGPFPVYNIKIRSLNYSYAESSFIEKADEVLDVGQTLELEFNIRYAAEGAYDYLPIGGSFIFSTQNHSLKVAPIKISVEKPISLSLQAPRSLVEKQENTLTLIVSNPSSLTVSDIHISLAFSGVETPQTPIELKISELKAGEIVNREVRFTPSSVFSLKILPTLKFSFDGETLLGESYETKLSVNENMEIRYALPIALSVALVIATAYISRRVSREKPLDKGE
ncbi:MAG: hypothetical protein QXY08_02220 [Nitrososphaerales archaeon]